MSNITIKVYPIWLCPARHNIHEGLEEYSMLRIDKGYVDVGLYG